MTAWTLSERPCPPDSFNNTWGNVEKHSQILSLEAVAIQRVTSDLGLKHLFPRKTE
jgi:hypothetical protein